MSSIYKYGARYYDIPDIMNKVDRPRDTSPQKEMSIWTPSEFQRFIAEVDNTYRLYFSFLYVSGCRRGEALALTWDDIDARSVRINKSVTTKTSSAAYLVTTPKNKGSIRKITVPEFIIDQLNAHREQQQSELGEAWMPSLFVFGGVRPLPTTSADRAFKKAIEHAGVKPIRIHDLRHSCASLLISKGISIVAVSRQLGHKNVEQTLNTYSHMMPDDTTMIYNALDKLGTFLGTEK
jgi:integrase